MTVRGVREWGYPLDDKSYDNVHWAEAYFMDIEMWKSRGVTMYLPLPIFNGSINANGFINKGFFGESYEYDPIKGQLVFIFNDGCEPTYTPYDDSKFLFRGDGPHNGHFRKPSDYFPLGSDKNNSNPWGCHVTLYKAALAGSPGTLHRYGVELRDVIYENNSVTPSELYVFRNMYDKHMADSTTNKFYQSIINQVNGYSVQSLKFLDTPKTDEWKHYNLAGTTYAFNSDFSESLAITGRGLPAAAVSSFSNMGCSTQKIFVSGTLLNDLLFNQEYDVWKKDNNNDKYVSESAVLKISFNH